LPVPIMWPKNRPFFAQCSPLYNLAYFTTNRRDFRTLSLCGRPHSALYDASSQFDFALTVFGSMLISLFSRGNARFVYHLVGLAKGHATPHRDPDFRFRFSLATDPQDFWGLALKPSFSTPNTLGVVLRLYCNNMQNHAVYNTGFLQSSSATFCSVIR